MSKNSDTQCYFVQLQIDTFLDGELGSEQQESFMAHIQSCQACANELVFARSMHDAVLDLPALACPDEVLEPVHRLGQQADSSASLWQGLRHWLAEMPMPLRYGIPVTAAVVLTLFLQPLNDGADDGNLVAEQNAVETYSQEDVVAALRDLNTAIDYLNEVSTRTETMIGGRFVVAPLQESLNATFERVQSESNPLDDDPI